MIAATPAKKTCNFIPMGDNVVIIPIERNMIGSIAVPDGADVGPQEGTVVAVGPGLWGMGGYAPMECAVGDRVMLFSDRPFERVPDGDQEYFVIRQVYLRLKRPS
jgi:co-chaperonin GroES (HSP10)